MLSFVKGGGKMKKKMKIMLAAVLVSTLLAGPIGASAGGHFQGCAGSNKPCYGDY